MPDSLSPSPCVRSPRSLRAGAVAVGVTGAMIVVVPFGLLLGKDGLVPVSANSAEPIPAPRLTTCDTRQPVLSHQLTEGQCVRIVGGGFEANELIEVSDSRNASWRTYVRADDAGRFSLRHVGRNVGVVDVLSFAGTSATADSILPRVTYCRLTGPTTAKQADGN